MIDGFVKVSKEEAKRIIDEAPGDIVYIAVYNKKTLLHKENKKKNKSYGKSLIDTAKEIGYQNNEIFGVIALEGMINVDHNWMQNILFPQFHRLE